MLPMLLALACLIGGPEAQALTPQSCAAGNACLCGEWTGAIWTWRKFGPAKCCDPGFVFRGKTRAQWEDHLRGPTKAFISAMEKKFGSQDTAACDPNGSSPELAPLLAAHWRDFEAEGLSCVCDGLSRPICKSFLQFIGDPKKGEGKGATCGWKDKGGEAASAAPSAAGGGAGGPRMPAAKAPGRGADATARPAEEGADAPGQAAADCADPARPDAVRLVDAKGNPLPHCAGLAMPFALKAVSEVRAAVPECADPARPNALRDAPECDRAGTEEVARQLGPDYTPEQAAEYWGLFKTLSVPPKASRRAPERRQTSK
ncbi:MAG: hypothetical protein HY553_13845 [Elusimicrobia bacterium]|nr:hypothetical protein [Elusimicrobiota bacterium]